MRQYGRRGQHLPEYAIMLGVAISAVITTQHYMTRRIGGALLGGSKRILGDFPVQDQSSTVTAPSTTDSSQAGDAAGVAVNSTSHGSGTSQTGFILSKPYGPYLAVLTPHKELSAMPSLEELVGLLEELDMVDGREKTQMRPRYIDMIKRGKLKENKKAGRFELAIDRNGDGDYGDPEDITILAYDKKEVSRQGMISDLMGALGEAVSFDEAGVEDLPMVEKGTSSQPMNKDFSRDTANRLDKASNEGKGSAKRILVKLGKETGKGFEKDAKKFKEFLKSKGPAAVEKALQKKTLDELHSLYEAAAPDIKELTEAQGDIRQAIEDFGGGVDAEASGGGQLTWEQVKQWEKSGNQHDITSGTGYDVDGDGMMDAVQMPSGETVELAYVAVEGPRDGKLTGKQIRHLADKKTKEKALEKFQLDMYAASGGSSTVSTKDGVLMQEFSMKPDGSRVRDEKPLASKEQVEGAVDAMDLVQAEENRRGARHDQQLKKLPDAEVVTLQPPSEEQDVPTMEEAMAAGKSPSGLAEFFIKSNATWTSLDEEAVPDNATPLVTPLKDAGLDTVLGQNNGEVKEVVFHVAPDGTATLVAEVPLPDGETAAPPGSQIVPVAEGKASQAPPTSGGHPTIPKPGVKRR